jgi:hypothetical protein
MNLFLQKHGNCRFPSYFDNNWAFFFLTVENKAAQAEMMLVQLRSLMKTRGKKRKTRSAQIQATIVIMTKKHTGIPPKSLKQLERTSTFVVNTDTHPIRRSSTKSPKLALRQ